MFDTVAYSTQSYHEYDLALLARGLFNVPFAAAYVSNTLDRNDWLAPLTKYAFGRAGEPFVITDVTRDEGFARHAASVGAPPIRLFVAIAILGNDGREIGSIAIAGPEAGTPTPTQIATLRALVRRACATLEMAPSGSSGEADGARVFREVAAESDAAIAISMADPSGGVDLRIVYVNPAFEALLGYTFEELRGRSLQLLYPMETSGATLEALRRAVRAGQPLTMSVENRHRDGTSLTVDLTMTPVRDERDIVTHWIATRRPVTRSGAREPGAEVLALEREIEQRKVAEARLSVAALHDELTGLKNRAYLEAALRRAIEAAAGDPPYRACLCFIDLDRFKRVNDRLGHLTGDLLLKLVARRLERCVRPSDVVARLGGDEFMVLLADVGDIEEARELAKRIAATLAAPYRLQRAETYVTASIGVASIDAETGSVDEILREADTAMYRAKERGRNRVAVFESHLRARDVALANLDSDLRLAWDRREFFVAYQPIHALCDGKIEGFEALLRWRHPTRGVVLPGEFVGVADENGMLVPLGEWLVTEASRQLRSWQGASRRSAPLTMSVNFSANQLCNPDLVDHLARVLAIYEIDPAAFAIELTETAIMEDIALAEDVVDRLRKLGVRLYMDRFGTGYSSLNYLRRLAVDRLKIDRAYISGEDGGLADPEIVDTIVSLAQKLGIASVAQGVETASQRDALIALGCDYAQGYLFGPILDAASAMAAVVTR